MSYLDSLEIECLRHALRAAVQRAEAAEAKLAELEKQEPVVWCNENDLKLMVNKRMIGGMMTVRHHGERPLFTRPAPATNLAELVPDEVLRRLECEAGHLVHHCHHIDEHSCKVNRRDLLTITEACRAAMLRNIEGTK